MASPTPTPPLPAAASANVSQPFVPPPSPISKYLTPPFKPSASGATDSTSPSTPQPPESISSATISKTSGAVVIPSYARWFSWDQIHETERRLLPEFFDSKSASRNPRVYKYYRDSIVEKYRGNPASKVTFTEVRREIVGDVGSIRKVFDFLETWGLINYAGSPPDAKLDEKEGKPTSAGPQPGVATSLVDSPASARKEVGRKVCDKCKSAISIACFSCDKVNLVLCARCFVSDSHHNGQTSADFKRVDIGDVITRKDWSDRDTLLLLEAVLHYGDDWKKVARHVSGRSEKECVHWFIKLPFADQFLEPYDIDDIDDKCSGLESDPIATNDGTDSDLNYPAKRMRLSPLADASNPIMAQAAFLSALVGSDVAKAAAEAAVAAVCNPPINLERQKHSISPNVNQGEDVVSDGPAEALDEAYAKAKSLLEQENKDLESSVSAIMLQMKEMSDRIQHFEQLELAMEKEWAHLKSMQSQLFEDKVKLLQPRAHSRLSGIVDATMPRP